MPSINFIKKISEKDVDEATHRKFVRYGIGDYEKEAFIVKDMAKKSKQTKLELLAPAGNWIMLRAVIEAGADAVYLGLQEQGLNMRQSAGNFSLIELKKAVDFCHRRKSSSGKPVKAYLTLNTIIYEDELAKLENIIKQAKKAQVDAVIVWDMAVVELLKKHKLGIILSTQASVSNSKSAEFYRKLGVRRITLARECDLKQIKQIHSKLGDRIELEAFVHGAMCVSISGRCFLSHDLFGKSANRGECLQPCRRVYQLKDIEEDNELVLGQDYILSPKDLCTLPFIDRLMDAGIKAFKIEGRTRSPEYAKVVTECYRKAIDAAAAGKLTKELIDSLVEKLHTVYNRKFSSGFYFGMPAGNDLTDVYGSAATTRKAYIGKVVNYFRKNSVAEIKLEAADVKIGDKIMIQGPTTGIVELEITADSMEWEHKRIEKAKKGSSVTIKVDKLVREGDNVFLIVQSR